jgi:tetratricopeptide (TPR) repeat protein
VTPSTSLRAGRAAVGTAAAVCLAAAVALHAAEDRWPAPKVDRPGVLYLRSPTVASRIVLDYDGIAADVYWIRALQHFGEERLSPPAHVRTYALLYPLLDLTTTLDPYFSIAYRFGAIFLGEAYPGGPGRPDLALALLQKGLAAQPTKWQYMMDLGFVYYWHLRDYKSAASAFQRASEMPGAPSWLRPLAAVTLAEGGHRDASRAVWQRLAQADEPWLRDSARLRLAQLDAMDAIESLQPRVQAFRDAHPGEPVTWDRLVAARLVPGRPLDSSGTTFALDPMTGAITIAPASTLFPLPGQIQAPR